MFQLLPKSGKCFQQLCGAIVICVHLLEVDCSFNGDRNPVDDYRRLPVCWEYLGMSVSIGFDLIPAMARFFAATLLANRGCRLTEQIIKQCMAQMLSSHKQSVGSSAISVDALSKWEEVEASS